MDNRLLCIVTGMLAVVVVVVGVSFQQERDRATGLTIDISKKHGLTLQERTVG